MGATAHSQRFPFLFTDFQPLLAPFSTSTMIANSAGYYTYSRLFTVQYTLVPFPIFILRSPIALQIDEDPTVKDTLVVLLIISSYVWRLLFSLGKKKMKKKEL